MRIAPFFGLGRGTPIDLRDVNIKPRSLHCAARARKQSAGEKRAASVGMTDTAERLKQTDSDFKAAGNQR